VPNLGRFRWWVRSICHQEGFIVNQDKFRVIRASQRQLVTGIVVNDELRVPATPAALIRAILHNCKKHGVRVAGRATPALRSVPARLRQLHQQWSTRRGGACCARSRSCLGNEKPD